MLIVQEFILQKPSRYAFESSMEIAHIKLEKEMSAHCLCTHLMDKKMMKQ